MAKKTKDDGPREYTKLTSTLIKRLIEEERCFCPAHVNKLRELSGAAITTREALEKMQAEAQQLQEAIAAKEAEMKAAVEKLTLETQNLTEDLRTVRTGHEEEVSELQDTIDKLNQKIMTMPETVAKDYRRQMACFCLDHLAIKGLRHADLVPPELLILSVLIVDHYKNSMIAPQSKIHLFAPEPYAGLVDMAKKIDAESYAQFLGHFFSKPKHGQPPEAPSP